MSYLELVAEARAHAELVLRLAAALEEADERVESLSRLHELDTERLFNATQRQVGDSRDDARQRVAEADDARAAELEDIAAKWERVNVHSVSTQWLRNKALAIRNTKECK